MEDKISLQIGLESLKVNDMSFNWIQEKDPVLVYVADPMCSWCYGFGPEITQVKEGLPDYPFKLVMGGLRPNGTETIGELGKHLKKHWEHVQQASGQPFQFDLLENPGFIYNTEPPSRAVVVVRKMAPEKEFEFFKAVQRAFYQENKDTNQIETYLELVKEMGLDEATFSELYESEDIRYETRADFQVSAEMGIRGFPAVLFRHNGEFFLASHGYQKAQEVERVIGNILKE